MKHAYIDEYSGIDSFIHKLDPRIKMVSFILFILFIVFTAPTSFVTFCLYALLIAVLIMLSKIPVKFMLVRSLGIIPFVLMIAAFIPFIKQGEVAGAYSFGSLRLSVTYSGLLIFWNVLIKAYLSILCMTLLMASTAFTDLLKAMQRLMLPQLIIMVLSFMYRYVFVIQDELMKMIQAKESRSAGGPVWFNIKASANMLGVLFVRTYERGESVYLAMCSRGFNGSIKTIADFRITAKDLFFLSAITVLLTAIRLING